MNLGRRSQIPFLIFLLFFSSFCFKVYCDGPVTENEGFYLSPSGLDDAKKKGLEGDSAAAHRVFLYYVDAENLAAMRNWAFISAQDGGPNYELDYAKILFQTPDTDSQLRSIFWTERALKEAKGRLPEAQEFLSELTIAMAHSGTLCDRYQVTSHQVDEKFDPHDALAAINTFSFQGILDTRINALCGDPTSAKALVFYYGLSHLIAQLNYFINIGAEDGDARSEFDLARLLAAGSPDDKSRALFWAKRSLLATSDPGSASGIQRLVQNIENSFALVKKGRERTQ